MPVHLPDYLDASARRVPDRTAVVDSDGRQLSYSDLKAQSDAVAAWLHAAGIRPGDRVGVVLPKSLPAVVALFGIMKAGAAWVPVDASAPVERARRILADCEVRAIILDRRAVPLIEGPDGPGGHLAAAVVVGATNADESASGQLTPWLDVLASTHPPVDIHRAPSDLAYLLYTSGSTGAPKGVMLTHANAISFVEWCASVFDVTDDDRFSSHAPFHFDLSVLDLYLPIRQGATVYLIGEALGKNPRELARFIATHRLTCWYSTPSILTLLSQFGGLEQHDCTSLRLVLFAGEVFPIKHLREITRQWPGPVFYNLYGPTETNVCTFARIPDRIAEDRDVPFPIGPPCTHCQAVVLDADGLEVPEGGEGLLYISGPSVCAGYWHRPEENRAAFVQRPDGIWYNTGDVVRWHAEDGYIYVGRRDRMVKRRGFRIELGEVERALYSHPRVDEAAVVSVPDPEAGTRIVAFLSCHGGDGLSIIDLKAHCATKVPVYMSPDRFLFRSHLPRTSTDKVDYQALGRQLADDGL